MGKSLLSLWMVTNQRSALRNGIRLEFKSEALKFKMRTKSLDIHLMGGGMMIKYCGSNTHPTGF